MSSNSVGVHWHLNYVMKLRLETKCQLSKGSSATELCYQVETNVN